MNCKDDCLYYEVCADFRRNICEADQKRFIEYKMGSDGLCGWFKNKADFVEVVRCKNCKHSQEQDKVFGITDYKCSKHNISCLSPYDFCSYGERKEQ